jgi:hypothetical protein
VRPISILVASLLVAVPTTGLLPPAPAGAAAAPVHTLTVDGTGVGTYPAFDPAVSRYAVTTTAATGGTLTVHATTSDPAGVVRVDGQVAPGGSATVTGLDGGDEVSVFIADSAGVEVHSLVYLPAGFPALAVSGTTTGLAPGVVGLTLSDILSNGTRFVTTVDRQGVPTHVLAVPGTRGVFDLKDQPDGSITFSETTDPAGAGEETVVLDSRWRELRRLRTVAGLKNTDEHDSILEPDGSYWLMAYEPDNAAHRTDSVIQHISAGGQELFRWSTAQLTGESVTSAPASGNWDYAHMNSMQVLPDGDVIASFRHFSAVYRIASVAHDGYQPGDIVWKLGGRHSDFAFVDDPDHGPCAQHTASVLPNGDVLVFDDGSDAGLSGPLCVDPADPTGPPVTRQHSRVAEWSLDETDHTATLVWSYAPSGYYSWFMGSARRLDNGDTLVGWAADTKALAQEVDADGALLWQLSLADPKPSPPLISYRASLMKATDADAPVVDRVSLADGTTYAVGQAATVDFRCTDVGGSSLRTCGGDLRPGGRLDTSTPGLHTLHLTATDGAGNTTTVTRSYTVTASYLPRWTADRTGVKLRGKRVSTKVTVVNAGTYADSFTLFGSRGTDALVVRYKVGHRDVTRRLVRGTFHTGALQPGQRFVLRVVVSRTGRTRPGDHHTFTLLAQSDADRNRDAMSKLAVRAR